LNQKPQLEEERKKRMQTGTKVDAAEATRIDGNTVQQPEQDRRSPAFHKTKTSDAAKIPCLTPPSCQTQRSNSPVQQRTRDAEPNA
jgi:hypothetical protein